MQCSMSRHRNAEYKTIVCYNFDMIKSNTDSSRVCEMELKILFMKDVVLQEVSWIQYIRTQVLCFTEFWYVQHWNWNQEI